MSQGDLFGQSNGVDIEQLRRWAREKIVRCPCCEGNIKVYRSPLGVTTRVLVWMVRATLPGEYCHVPSAPTGWLAGGGDYAKLRYWGLIEGCPEPVGDDKRASGRWRLTTLGRDFALRRATVPSHCFWRHPGGVLGFEPETVDIVTALGKNFDYGALLRGEA